MEVSPYQILLYYKYVPIDHPTEFADQHRALCQQLDLKGRIIVAHEGINGTVSGTPEQTESYMDAMRSDPRFQDMAFKIDPYHQHAFPKLSIKVRSEIVPMKLSEDFSPTETTGVHVPPEQFMKLLEQDDVVIIDGRNDYEWDIGHFRGAIRPDVQSFREFPDWIEANREQWQGKKLLTYCTGGIRCEKLSGFLVREGFEEVYQLDGGIVTYGKDPAVRGRHFEGKCYVFDERIAVPVNQEDDVVVGRCHHCGVPADTYINCAYPKCHHQHIVCGGCRDAYAEYCSVDCRTRHSQVAPTATL